jgi:spore maturation protein SpmA
MSKRAPAVINYIWLCLLVLAVLAGMATGTLEAVTNASFESAKTAVTLAINLVGAMALWLGLMKIAEQGGLMRLIARALRPLMTRLFPNVPPEHPAMGAMIMNIAANMLGLGNAATPLGIKAMVELDKLSRIKGRATNAMCLFLAINTSNVTLLPLGVMAVRHAAGAAQPASIMVPSLLATMTSTLVAIMTIKLIEGKGERETAKEIVLPEQWHANTSDEKSRDELESDLAGDEQPVDLVPPGKFGRMAVWSILAAVLGIVVWRVVTAGDVGVLGDEIKRFWIIPLLMLAIVLFGYARGVKVYEAATDGAKEGFQVAIRIIPFLVMILVVIGMFRASGAFDAMAYVLAPVTGWLGIPTDVLSVALMRPLSGSGAFGLMTEIVNRAPDSLESYMSSIMQGSTETTFYVLAVYFGAVGITRTRHAITAALVADAAGILAAAFLARLTYPG